MLVVVVPAYNEANKIGRVLRDLFEHGYKDIVVVDDGSTDKTAEIAKEHGASVIIHPLNRGQGAALQTGDEYALSIGAQTIIHFDADGQFDPKDINYAVSMLIEKNCDIVLGSRFLDRRSKIPITKKFIIIPIARIVNYLFTGVWLSDAHNGFRVFSANTAKTINITQDGMAHNTEIIRYIKRYNLRYCECPVKVIYDEYGQNFFGGIKIITDIIKSKIFN